MNNESLTIQFCKQSYYCNNLNISYLKVDSCQNRGKISVVYGLLSNFIKVGRTYFLTNVVYTTLALIKIWSCGHYFENFKENALKSRQLKPR